MTHSPLPWEAEKGTLYGADDFEIGKVYNAKNPPCSGGPQDKIAFANAAFIVKACNLHHRLMAFVRKVNECNEEGKSTGDWDDLACDLLAEAEKILAEESA